VEWLRSLVKQPPASTSSSTVPTGPAIPATNPEGIPDEVIVGAVDQLLRDESGDALRKKLSELGWAPLHGQNAKSTKRVVAELLGKMRAEKGVDAVRDYLFGYRSNYQAGKRVATDTSATPTETVAAVAMTTATRAASSIATGVATRVTPTVGFWTAL
jgi:hypothetical protein